MGVRTDIGRALLQTTNVMMSGLTEMTPKPPISIQIHQPNFLGVGGLVTPKGPVVGGVESGMFR